MKYEAVIFDLDGVIVITDSYHQKAWKISALEFGIDYKDEWEEELKGLDRRESMERLLKLSEKLLSKEEKKKFLHRKNELYLELIEGLNEAVVMRGVKETIIKLRKNGIKTAVGSTSKNAMRILSLIGLTDLFDYVSYGENIKKGKPEPEVFLNAAAHLKVSPSKCLVVEDGEAGVKAANRAHMDCAYLSKKRRSPYAQYNIEIIEAILPIVFS